MTVFTYLIDHSYPSLGARPSRTRRGDRLLGLRSWSSLADLPGSHPLGRLGKTTARESKPLTL